MLPAIASSISASVGLGFCLSSAVADITCPAWQYPHCGTPRSTQAACTALPTLSAPIASMVTTFLLASADIGVTHARPGWPSICTVQAPHKAMPQPNLVPVRPSSSRSTHSSGVSEGRSTSYCLPLMLSLVIFFLPLRQLSAPPMAKAHPADYATDRQNVQSHLNVVCGLAPSRCDRSWLIRVSR